ncbi:Ger(x)C family spore germination protein [Clostridium sp. P21]|uniref:Ger(X)C family spore germination protein n=1 Tax=Clostridium muellerianum TaxID=2716538 RepID=A0A7Y0EHT5_9CLOT|nr:Ger(x)C family spore germination protein [Clostridium muellerianum]NMM63740.1 Ger(x)C family spore germination protein [Clostridium muellerianum]
MNFRKALIIFIILQSTCLTGCWSSKEINTLAIVVATGIDKTEKGYLISEQVINPKVIAAKKATNETPVVLYTAEGRDLDSAIRSITAKSPRAIYNSHLRMVILGNKVAEDGIKDILDYFARNHEYRTDFYFAVAKNRTAKEILSVLTPIESIPGIYMYNSLKLSSREWAPTKAVRIIELVNSIISDGKNPVITGIEISEGETLAKSMENLKQSGEIKKIAYSGLGVFEKDKLIGWLNEDESKGYNYIVGNVKGSVGYSYYGDKVKITGEVINAKTNVKVSLVNDKPVINVKINVKQNIGAVEGEFDVSKEENQNILNKIGEERIKLICEKAVNKAQNELKSDIFGFGEAVHRKNPKLWAKIKGDWSTEFTHVPVNIMVNLKTNQLGQITKSFFIKEK